MHLFVLSSVCVMCTVVSLWVLFLLFSVMCSDVLVWIWPLLCYAASGVLVCPLVGGHCLCCPVQVFRYVCLRYGRYCVVLCQVLRCIRVDVTTICIDRCLSGVLVCLVRCDLYCVVLCQVFWCVYVEMAAVVLSCHRCSGVSM